MFETKFLLKNRKENIAFEISLIKTLNSKITSEENFLYYEKFETEFHLRIKKTKEKQNKTEER